MEKNLYLIIFKTEKGEHYPYAYYGTLDQCREYAENNMGEYVTFDIV